MGIIIKKPLAAGLFIYALYLAIFYSTWTLNNVEYGLIGKNVDTIKLGYAIPTLLASLSVFLIISSIGWWNKVMFDQQKSSSRWTYILPIAILAAIIANFTNVNTQELSIELIFWSIVGGIGVGFGEEVITRGSLIVGLRSRLNEGKVWFVSTLLFAALHAPNVFFGLDPTQMVVQLFVAFIMGTAFYVIRRVSGSLILAILLHGLWDSSVFLPQATGSQNLAVAAILIYPLAIACAIPVLKRNWKQNIK
jgi:membrane protease YdiL (CAAX protease family)